MAFEVNNNGIQKLDNVQQKKKYIKPENKPIEGENRDYSEAYSALGASAMAQFQAGQNIKKSQHTHSQIEIQTSQKTEMPTFKNGNEFLAYLKKGSSLSDEEVNDLLISKGFSLAEINNFRENYKDLNSTIEYLKLASEVEDTNIDLKTITKDELKESLAEFKDDKYATLIPLLNEENVQFFQKYLNIEDRTKAINLFGQTLSDSLDYPEDFNNNFAKAIEITKICQTDDCFQEVIRSWSPCTPEQAIAYKKIADVLETEPSLCAASYIEHPEEITPEFLEDLKKVAENLKNKNIETDMHGNPTIILEDMHKIDDFCEEHDLNFNEYKKYQKNPISRYSIKNIIDNTKDPNTAKEIIENCSKKSKEKYEEKIIDFAGWGSLQKHPQQTIKLIDTIADFEKRVEYRYFDLQSCTSEFLRNVDDIENLGGVADLLQTFYDLDIFPYGNSLVESLHIKNEDFENAVKFVKELTKTFTFKTEDGQVNNFIPKHIIDNFNPDIDFKKALTIIDEIKERKLEKTIELNSLRTILKQGDIEAIDKYEMLLNAGCKDDYYVNGILANENVTKESLDNKIKTIENIIIEKHQKEIDLLGKDCVLDLVKQHTERMVHIISNMLYAEENPDYRFDPSEPIRTINDIVDNNNVNLIKKMYKNIENGFSAKIINDIGSALVNNDYEPKEELIEFAQDLCFNEELNFPKDLISSILNYTRPSNIDIAKQMVKIPDIDKQRIWEYIKHINNENSSLAKNLYFNEDYNLTQNKYHAFRILEQSRTFNLDFIEKICKDKDLKEVINDLPYILPKLDYNRIDLATKIYTDKDLDFDKTKIKNFIENIDNQTKDFVEQLLYDKTLKMDKELKANILTKTTINNVELAKKLCFGEASHFSKEDIPNVLAPVYYAKHEKYEKLALDPKMSGWLMKNLNKGFINAPTLVNLAITQKKFYREAEEAELKAQKAQAKEEKALEKRQEIVEAKSEDIERAEKLLVDMGVHPKMAPNYIKLCQQNGVVDNMKLDAVCALAKVNVPFKEFKNIFNIATGTPLSNANGQFRPAIIKDIVQFKKLGIDDVKLATNLSATKNMSDIELHSRLNTNIRTDMANRLDELPETVKEQLTQAGFDLDAIKEKALKKPKARNINQELAPKNPIVLRTLDSIQGAERVVLNKFKNHIPQETWQNPEAFKKWAEDKLEDIINAKNDFELKSEFTATGQFEHFNNPRKEGIKKWYEYLTTESNYKDDVFVHLLVMDGVTREMQPDNAYTPPAVSHESFEATYNALLQENTKVSFSDMYAQLTKKRAIQKYGKEPKIVDDIEGQWVTIPRSKRGEPDYDENVAMVQALAEGSSWCLRFENAHGYLQGGNLHYFLDKNGKAQVAINETDGNITQIQKRYNQNSTVPIAYSTVIEEWAKENNYNGWDRQRKNAIEAKPEFDKLRAELKELMDKKEYIKVLDRLGVITKENADGTISVGTYQSKLKDGLYYIPDLNINENELMHNVSRADSLFLQGSGLTALPNLKSVDNLQFSDCTITDLSSLEKIGDKEIYWDKLSEKNS